MKRCVNIDWLEVFVNESPRLSYDPDDFTRRGYWVKVREYGTMTMAQMFVICDHYGEPMIEIRRLPRGIQEGKKSVYMIGDSYIRLTNQYCYIESPVRLLWDFITANRYEFKKIYRIDLCLDFVRFDRGDLPSKVARRISTHVYSKLNQTNRRTSGDDTWTECKDDWFSWGAARSMVSTKFYNKSKEQADTKNCKPYIISQWLYDGVIDNAATMSKDGNHVDVWRLEFSIHSSAKEWVMIQKEESEDGARHFLPHTLDLYETKDGIWQAIKQLIPHYFRFKIYEEGKRKSLCKDKVLFVFDPTDDIGKFRLMSASDAHRIRSQINGEYLTYIRTLSRLLNHVGDEQAKLSISDAIDRLNKIVRQNIDRETFDRETKEMQRKLHDLFTFKEDKPF